MRGAAATDGSVLVGQRPVQQLRGDLTRILVLSCSCIQNWDPCTLVSSGFGARLTSALLLDLWLTLWFFERTIWISGGSCDCTGWFPRKAPPQMAAAKMEGQDLQNRHVLGTGFWNGASSLKQYFVFPKNGSKYYHKYTFLAFPVLGILDLGTSLLQKMAHRYVKRTRAQEPLRKQGRI